MICVVGRVIPQSAHVFCFQIRPLALVPKVRGCHCRIMSRNGVSTGRNIDWLAFRQKSQTFTLTQLLEYNAAGTDPYIVQVAELLGQQIRLGLPGQRNLANAFGSLPQAEFFGQHIGIGYPDGHPARTLANSDGGFMFLGVCAALSEYYAEDVVVGVIMEMLSVFDIPINLAPSDLQWKTLVHLCYGVLSTSPFGLLITRSGTALPLEGASANIRLIVDGLLGMSDIVDGAEKKISLSVGVDVYWFAAVAEYLFGLSFYIEHESGTTLASSPGVDATHAQVQLSTQPPNFRQDSPDLRPLLDLYPGTIPVTGGRVGWEKLFRSCFGRAFTDIDNHLLADGVSCLAGIVAASIEHQQTNTQLYFLPQASTVPGLSGSGLVETLTGWFPELRRLAPQMGKYAHAPFQEARDRLDEVTAALSAACMCSFCGNASSTSTDFCKHTLLVYVLNLGLTIARTVTVPNLFPKRSGILSAYRQHHEIRKDFVTNNRRVEKAEDFMDNLASFFPTPRTLIEETCNIFTGTQPDGRLTEETLALSHEGIFVSVTAWNPLIRRSEVRQRAGVAVTSGSSHFQSRIVHQALWSKGLGGLSYSESLEVLRTRPKDVQRIVKMKEGYLYFSFVFTDSEKEKEAERNGWTIM